MTALRPEGTHGADPLPGRHRAGPPADAPADPYAEQVGHAEQQAFEAAVARLADPLNDPLPGREPIPVRGEERPETDAPPYTEPRAEPYAPGADRRVRAYRRPVVPKPAPVPDDETMTLRQACLPADETMTLRRVEAVRPVPGGEPPVPAPAPEPVPEPVTEPVTESAPGTDVPPPGGRAARRRAARASRESPMVVASRVVGELFITLGVVMLLFVSYQLWWTNVIADRQAGNEAKKLEQRWGEKGDGESRDPGAFSAGEGFAIMHIPKLDVKVPVAEGVDEGGVLDRGMVGHYGEEPLKTAMPWDEKGNFAVAGHRNTHGEPFRYINKLDPGDPIVVETEDTYYVYEMASRLDSTLPSNVGVIDPVPGESGFTEPGRYITLTTCTPEFTSKYRMIVWGKLAEERPRSEGKPDSLVR
ncbi:class E sortase [Streptomyces sp. CNQ085]|uniref:class E sortase n=1 Tax=Streptomyces sp. CNQ085 TaxID=2886944 RepID=UPI001F508787|nr:class E sortase [Streptomyces sp. CNQ085]MCI0383540.1 class E sortase [Streptomyces sp. CNQ085]